MRYREIAFRIPGELLDTVSGLLWEAQTLGLLVSDDDGTAQASVKAFFLESTDPEPIIRRLRGLDPRVAIQTRVLQNGDWPQRWKQYFGSCCIGQRLLVVPPWERLTAREHPDRIPIIVEPGSAFGTGQHSTTVLCLERLEASPLKGCCCLDLGTGSGILTIAALKLGAHRVVAIDRDPEVEENFRRNVELNGLRDGAAFILGTPACLRTPRFDLVFANIDLKTIAALAPNLMAWVPPQGGRLILSGFLREDIPEVLHVYQGFAPAACSSFTKNGWGAVEVRSGWT